MKFRLHKYILFYTAIIATAFALAYFCLPFFDLTLRQIPYYCFSVLITLGTVSGIVQIILKIKKRALKAALIIAFIPLASYACFQTAANIAHNSFGESVVVYGDGKWVKVAPPLGADDEWLPDYYVYKNPFVYGCHYEGDYLYRVNPNPVTDEYRSIPCQYVKAFLLKRSPNEEYPQVVSIGSAGELSEYIEKNEDVYDLSEFKSAAAKYNNDYFNNKSLVLILTREGSGSTYYQSVSINRKDKEVAILRATPVPFTEDLAYWHIIAEVEKDEPILTNSDDYNIWFTE